jgi:hypothetical protein
MGQHRRTSPHPAMVVDQEEVKLRHRLCEIVADQIRIVYTSLNH